MIVTEWDRASEVNIFGRKERRVPAKKEVSYADLGDYTYPMTLRHRTRNALSHPVPRLCHAFGAYISAFRNSLIVSRVEGVSWSGTARDEG